MDYTETPQLVRVLRGRLLWRPIFDCLNEISWPTGLGQDFKTLPAMWDLVPKKGNRNWCSQYNGYCPKSCKIPNIVWEPSDMEYSASGYLTVKIEWAEIWEDSHPGLRDKVVNAVANAYMAMTDNENNCHWVNFKGSRRTKLCHISPRVMVILPRNGGNIKGRLNVGICFQADEKYGNQYTKNGKFDCQGSIKGIASKVKQETRSGMSEVIGWGQDKMSYFGLCQQHECFDTHNGYNFGRTWNEQNNCNSPESSDEV